MKKYLALDLVLLPQESDNYKIIKINKALESSNIFLSKETTVPHLSLSMVRVEEEQFTSLLSRIKDYLEVIDLKELSLLRIDSLYQHNQNTVGWNFFLSPPLKGLHYSLCKLIQNYHFDKMSSKYNDDFTFINPKIPYSGIDYLNDFYKQYAFENYQPHITIGQGEKENCESYIGENIKFDSIALFHMGTGCTCEKKLWEMKISNIK